MKKLALILVFFLLTSCISNVMGKPAVPLKAVYFVHGQGELSSEDLQAHPEVAVVHTFDEFKQHAKQKVALWVDKNATPFEPGQEKWINDAPQTYYPIVLIGTSDTLYAFRDLLRLCCFMGPADNYPGVNAPGFSVIQWKQGNEPDARNVILLQGFNQKLTVQAILEITNILLEGKIQPTPTATYFLATTPTATSTSAMGTRPVLLYDDWPSGGFPMDAAHITVVTLEKNILKLQITYQGGCREHTFELNAATAFLLSNPPQGLLHLSHDAHGDTCAEQIEKGLSFDLAPLNESRAGRKANPLILRVYEPVGGSFAKEPYMPLIEWP